MKPAPIPQNELARLKDLISYEILDTAPEPLLDDITVLASTICETPISLVSLIDADRQWFKARTGLEAPETPRDISFCGHAITQTDVFVVEDSFADSRFADNPLVTNDPKVRFYAGAPLINANGHALGTLCVIDHVPRKLTAAQSLALSALARQVVALMEARRDRQHLLNQFKDLQRTSQLLMDHEQRLIAASKMAALGEMAAGVAHEINNPLAVVSVSMDLLKKKISDGTSAPSELLLEVQRTKSMTIRMASIVQGLLDFSERKPTSNTSETSTSKIIDQTLLLCSERFSKGNVLVKIDVENVSIECRQIQIEQVLINLLNNSFRAIMHTTDPWVKITARDLAGQEVEISVTDSGTGIDPKIVPQIMNPFFTTAIVGQGVGLGLSISKGLIEAHGGRLFYDATKSNTTFVIHLPRKQPRTTDPAA